MLLECVQNEGWHEHLAVAAFAAISASNKWLDPLMMMVIFVAAKITTIYHIKQYICLPAAALL